MKNHLASIAVILLFGLLGNPAAKAACSQDGVQCNPVTDTRDGRRQVKDFDLDYATQGQSVVFAGEADDYYGEMPFLRRHGPKNTGVDITNQGFDQIHRFCLHDYINDYFGSTLAKAFRKVFGNRCYSYGASATASMGAGMFFTLGVKVNTGSVDINYPVTLALDLPDVDSYNPGDVVELYTGLAPRAGASVVALLPKMRLKVKSGGDAYGSASATACLDSCTSLTLFDFSGSGSGEAWVPDPLYFNDFNPADPADAVGFLAGSTGHINWPQVAQSTITTDQYKLIAKGEDEFVDLNISLETWLMRFVRMPGAGARKIAYKIFGFLFVQPFDVIASIHATLKQTAIFDPEFRLLVQLGRPMNWEERDPAGTPVDSGYGTEADIQVGHRLVLFTTASDTTPVSLNAVAYQKNNFHIESNIVNDSWMDFKLFKLDIETPSWTIFSKRCIDTLLFGEVCLPRLGWDAITYHEGPVFEQNQVGRLTYDYDVLDTPTQHLAGFQRFPLQPSILDPNLPPTAQAIPTQYLHWNQFVDLDLNAYFSDPDGNPLAYQAIDLPPFLSLNGNRIQGTVNALHDGTVTIIADDGHGRSVTQSARFAVAMPLVDTGDGLKVTETGEQDSFDVTLSIPPQQNVDVRVIPQNDEVDLGAGAGNPWVLTFTPANWDQPQTVTISAIDDLVDEVGAELATNFVFDSSSAQAGFSGMAAPGIQTQVVDDDVAGIVADPAAGAIFSESSGVATFNIQLKSQPTANVTVDLGCRLTPCPATFAPSQLVFTPLNWNVPQSVTATGVPNNVADGSHQFILDFAAPVSGDPLYAALTSPVWPPLILAMVSDDDQPGVTITPETDIVTTEGGGQAVVSVVLSSQPSCAWQSPVPAQGGNAQILNCTVTVHFGSSLPGEVQVTPASVDLDENTWNVPQQVVLQGLDDVLDDGDQSFVITTSLTTNAPETTGYNSIDPVDPVGINQDDDDSLVSVTPLSPSITGEDGSSAQYALALTAQPQNDITVSVQSMDSGEGVPQSASFTFTPSDWNQSQTLTVQGVDDVLVDGVQNYQVQVAAAGDPGYDAFTPLQLRLSNNDNDQPGVVMNPYGSETMSEAGGTVDYAVSLASEPVTSLTLRFVSNRPDQATVSPASMVFGPGNWNSPQTLTATAVDDDVHDGGQLVTIQTRPIDVTVPGWGGYDPQDLVVTVTDDDVPGITITPTSGLQVSEPDGAASFEIRLTSRPKDQVEIPLSLSGAGMVQLGSSSVFIEPESWDQPRVVSIQALDNDMVDGSRSLSVITGNSISPGDADYDGINLDDVSLAVLDDDVPGILVSPVQGLATGEDGTQASFQVRLASRPSAPVSIGLSLDNTGEASLSASQVTIPAADWDQPVQVTVTGKDDLMVDGDQIYHVMTQAASSGDGHYDGLNPDDVELLNADNDSAGLTLNKTLLQTTEAGGSDSFSVRLSARPVGEVRLIVNNADPSEGDVSPAGLVFNTTNWNQPQQVTVTGKDDVQDDGDQTYEVTVNLDSSSPDPGFRNLYGYTVTVTNKDDGDPRVLVAPVSGLFTDESGSGEKFKVSLDQAPASGTQVEVRLNSSDATEGKVVPNVLVFTPDNWDQPHQAAVVGLDDNLDDGDKHWQVLTAPVISSDPHFAGYDPADISVINRDEDVDTDDDGVVDILEGDDDRDNDHLANRLDYDPTGYIYDSETGEIITGGRMEVRCSRGSVAFVDGRNGINGYYQYVVSGIGSSNTAECRQTFTPPPGYMPDWNCGDQGTLDVPDGPLPLVLGSDEDGNTGVLADASCTANPYHQVLRVQEGDAPIFSNNFAVVAEATSNTPVPLRSYWSWLLSVFSILVLAGLYWRGRGGLGQKG
ncbi:hypothetical protein [Thiolapillus brandeum]|uniref:Cadherin domain-containing protein n=1 Tax=Thiolapillus brandeum TaxID=1076588 RepID=A0A7U6GHL0_9GAMM|nr:hypothetical protein [Thiolapillus brandeum]BAO43766.1 hypothetical protein TBH_C0831 [Thiolapillus brandeum]